MALSEVGVAHCFGLGGDLQHVLPTINVGYRGAIRGSDLWVASWSPVGEMSRTNLRTGERSVFNCTPLANSVVVDEYERVWVAGDTGVSVSDRRGKMFATMPSATYANGLTSLRGRTFHVTHAGRQGWLKELGLVTARAHLPALSVAQRATH